MPSIDDCRLMLRETKSASRASVGASARPISTYWVKPGAGVERLEFAADRRVLDIDADQDGDQRFELLALNGFVQSRLDGLGRKRGNVVTAVGEDEHDGIGREAALGQLPGVIGRGRNSVLDGVIEGRTAADI